MGGTGTMIFWAVGATGTVLFLALMGRKVGRVCRPDYREIMAHTTPPKVRSHPLATCLMIIILTPLVLFVLLLLIPMLAPLFYES
jgi:hypothetical protein